MTTILLILIVFVILASIVAVEAKELLSTVISVGAAGLALSVVFLLLGAPDLAITQVVVEVLCLILLIRTAVYTENINTYEAQHERFVVAIALVGGGIFLLMGFFAFQSMIPFGAPIEGVEYIADQYIQNAMTRTGAANAVMAVLLDFRAYDTLGEATVIFCSIIGAYAVLRRIGRLKNV